MDIDKLIEKLTLEEKCSLVVGKNYWETKNIDRLDIPSIFMADGPHGLRKVVDDSSGMEKSIEAVCYPSLVTLASSFNPKIAYKMGEAIASEFKANDVSLVLGPGINIKRHPFCGRNFEYFSEDPYVSTKMAEGFIKGVKSKNVGVCLKHFALNSQEDYRMTSNSVADSRAKYEIYYKSFQELIKLNPEMVMCSYNKVDGTYASENIQHLKEVLREEFGFNGLIVSDWSAVNSRTDALIATLDLEMPGHIYSIKKLIKDYKSGLIPIKTLDDSVRRVLELVDKYKNKDNHTVDLEKNHLVAAEIAAESMVLLKNKDELLPLRHEDRVLLIGDMAKNIRYQGGGSSHINPYRVDNIYDYLTKHENVDYVQGYCHKCNEHDKDLLDEVKNLAPNYSKIVLVCGLTDAYESEGYDREHLSLPSNQEYLINQVSKFNENVILVLQIGSPIALPFKNNVKAIVNCYLGGEGLGMAIDKVLYGDVNPSGRLAETFPIDHFSIPSDKYFKTGNNNVFYQESIYVGYRYYCSTNQEVLFPFGYGKSYSHFEYSNLKVNKEEIKTKKQTVNLSVDVTNNGPMDGKEVVMLFFEAKNPTMPRPKRELIGFDKVMIKNSETKTVKFSVNASSFNYYHPELKEFICDNGKYSLQICRNARDILVEKQIEVNINTIYEPSVWNELDSYTPLKGLTFKNEDYEKLINIRLKDQHIKHNRPFTINNSLEDIEDTFIGKIVAKQFEKQKKDILEGNEEQEKMINLGIKQMPLRSLAILSHGRLKLKTVQFIIELINRNFLKAIKYLMKR